MMTVRLGFDEVRRLLPQSYPFVLVDVIEEWEADSRIVCRKNVTGNEWMFPGHFPERAIYPGVLLIEGMAQSAILLFRLDESKSDSDRSAFMIAGVKARFLRPVVPGDQIRYECTVIKMVSTGGVVEATAQVDGEIVAKADLTFAVQP
ncbi:3-hydroxyacyl-ACP dehydratase FabZ [Brevibacillus humidisoli]|uniref:3-hydroxyacyl-ACP dehydratase FabZ n=1 Tax=Brevibacillus humidisoli TaxID=2895522 RepID=UPI001E508E0D|nr:3-hydroxyacyl-ACP dehydratase FabZ [Brevibacillus humidisoli]UFJ42568.1 3-hydroxyacyl-ACP dehydratase FabZ [Brevibacillus humidisoli]